MRRYITSALAVLFVMAAGSSVSARNPVEPVKKGNEAFLNKDYKKALEQYSIAETELPESPEIDYNIGNVQYEQGDYKTALERYEKALKTDDIAQQFRANYNAGNAHFKAGSYPEAIESYKKALEINPEDMDAKYNLELSRKLLKEQTQEEQQQNEQQQQEQQEKQEQQQQEQQQDQEDQQQQQQQQDQQDQRQQNQDDQQQQQEQMQDKPMSKEDAERILNALEDDEQDVQKKVRRNVKASSYLGKDW